MPYNDYPIEECAKTLEPLVAKGCIFYQKWTCEKCGDRVTGNEANKLFTEGHHEECGHTTDLKKCGCNYMLLGSGNAGLAILDNLSEETLTTENQNGGRRNRDSA